MTINEFFNKLERLSIGESLLFTEDFNVIDIQNCMNSRYNGGEVEFELEGDETLGPKSKVKVTIIRKLIPK